ncbi:hypothetical protein [uncultured Phascolarctobacterium sp.]|uniref:hypothetical protein n=1 Tax=uncultured Phascolarctobacterium sp. TaxID=512296 RepID=UPI00265CDF17|nr:hypothetical protein [uncultured Phascolarctobacterium sp.]
MPKTACPKIADDPGDLAVAETDVDAVDGPNQAAGNGKVHVQLLQRQVKRGCGV